MKFTATITISNRMFMSILMISKVLYNINSNMNIKMVNTLCFIPSCAQFVYNSLEIK